MALRVAVVGHVEWVTFARVDHLPVPGEIVHAHAFFEAAAGGGAVAAVQLAKLAGESLFFTALASDDLGTRAGIELAERGVHAHVAERPPPQRRAFTHVDDAAERTITVMGERIVPHGHDPLPWEELAECDGVYFTGGDAEALRGARSARVLVATPRARETLRDAGVQLDAVVHSGRDSHERFDPGELSPLPRLVVTTLGDDGGTWEAADGARGSWKAVPPPGPVVDSYGAGDSFAACLTYGLAKTSEPQEAVEFAARCAAACLSGHGPYDGQITG